ncbi:acyl-CoA carboxylase epsilon subunit [Actinosynnema sp. NPDC049800]
MTARDRRLAAVGDRDPRSAVASDRDPHPVVGGQDLRPELLLRVEKGDPDPVELAALAAVLRLRAAAVAVVEEEVPRRAARWRRPERVAGFAGARTWRN